MAALNVNSKMFVMHMAIRKQEKIAVNSKKQAHIGALLFNKALTEVPAEYINYNNVFSEKYVAKLSENTGINEHVIKLEKGEQLLFGPIYSLRPVELEILKTYIKTSQANGFIQSSNSPTGVPILFDKKPDKSLRLCVNYCGLNNITIKNRYLLLLIGKSLD